MILAVDIGNSNIVLGCFDENEILFEDRLSTDRDSTVLEYAVIIKTSLEMHHLEYEQITGATAGDGSQSRNEDRPEHPSGRP